MDLDSLNRIVGSHGGAWLGAAHEPAFDRLVGEIRARLRPDDKFEIPPFQAPKAWAAAWEIFSNLRDRQVREAHSAEAAEAMVVYRRSAEIDRRWNEYLKARLELLTNIDRSGLYRADALQCIGLEEADLVDPVDASAPGGRCAHWDQLAGRIAGGLNRWRRVAAADQGSIPFMAAAQRGAAGAKRLAQIEPYIENALNTIEQRVVTLENALGAVQLHLQDHDLEKLEQRLAERVFTLENALGAVLQHLQDHDLEKLEQRLSGLGLAILAGTQTTSEQKENMQ